MLLLRFIKNLSPGTIFLFWTPFSAQATRTGGKAEHMEHMTDLYGPLTSSGSQSNDVMTGIITIVLIFVICLGGVIVQSTLKRRKQLALAKSIYLKQGWKSLQIHLEVAEELKEENPSKYAHLVSTQEFLDYAKKTGIKIDTESEPAHTNTL